ncbi:MAG: LPS export ABC transporter periplasmic protein LptC [Pyrinomonadaceae bacterium]
MPDPDSKTNDFRIRARLPLVARWAAVAAMAASVLIVGIGFYIEKTKPAFRLRSEHTRLSTEVVAEVSGYERLETDGNVRKYLVRADLTRTYTDNHQELENVYIEIYDDAGSTADKLKAQKALYIPEENKNFTVYLSGDVDIDTRDRLHVETEHLVYAKSTETAEADEAVTFSRDNVSGSCFGATVNVAAKRLEMLRDVAIDIAESEDTPQGLKQASLRSGWAAFDQQRQIIELRDAVEAIVHRRDGSSQQQTITSRSARALASISQSDAASQPQLTKVELFESVSISSEQSGSAATTIDAGYASYDRPADRFDLRDAVHIVTTKEGNPADIRSTAAVYWQSSGRVELSGGAEITQGINYLKGDRAEAFFNAARRLRNARVTGSALVRQTTPDQTVQAAAEKLTADLGDDARLRTAEAVDNATAVIVPARPDEFTRITMSSPRAIKLAFKGEGALDRMTTQGRTTIQLNAPDSRPDAANKRLTADSVTTTFDAAGKNIQRAEASGNAEVYVEPLRASAENYRTTITAPRFTCDFYDTGNNAKICVGATKTKTVRVPTVAAEGRGEQTLVADRISASFGADSRDVERLDAEGNAKFTELDRNAVAAAMTFTQGDRTVRLRGGEPTAWDSTARVKAGEIDWDTANQKTYFRSSVSSTYYSRRQMKDAAPFASGDKPVFVTADTAEFDNLQEIGVYSGNARGWQENNFVRADKFVIRQRSGEFYAEGNVQSALYDVKQKGRADAVPVFASSATMSYSRDTRVIGYRSSVDIRQGTDRITAESADVYLSDRNELSKTIAEQNVVITQPGRRAAGSWVQYTAEDEVAVLRGDPARVEDGEKGSSQGAQITVYLRTKRVVGEAKTAQRPAGRIRSVYKVANVQ